MNTTKAKTALHASSTTSRTLKTHMNPIRPTLFFALIIIGIASGIIGILLSHLLHFIQHHSYHYALHGENIPFLIGVSEASGTRRFLILSLCGIFVGVGWYLIHRFLSAPISIEKSLKENTPMPFLTTICHSLLQIFTVGLGSPMGREVAPRELSVLSAQLWLKHLKFSKEENKLLIACASGSALAAIYNVPLAGTLFILEVLLISAAPSSIISALTTCAIAALIARFGLGDLVQYHLKTQTINNALTLWAILIGPIIALIVHLFKKSQQKLPFLKRNNPRIIPYALLAFMLIGSLSIAYPSILGNGKAGNQLIFWGLSNGLLSYELFLIKWLVLLLALSAGAYGGLITPSMMLGSTLSAGLAFLGNTLLGTNAIPIESAGLIGACAFLGLSLKMPLTAIIFCLELTRVNPAFLFPMALAMASATLCYNQYTRKTNTAI